jgi:hypothetical protein
MQPPPDVKMDDHAAVCAWAKEKGDATNMVNLATMYYDPFVKAIETAKLFLDTFNSQDQGKVKKSEMEQAFCANPYQLFRYCFLY